MKSMWDVLRAAGWRA